MTMILVMLAPRSIADAKAHLAEYVANAEAGARVVLTRHGRPVAALVPLADLQWLEQGSQEDPQAGLAGLIAAWDSDGGETDADADGVFALVIAERTFGRALPNLAG